MNSLTRLSANSLGQTVSRVSLFIFGGLAQMSGEPATARHELLIAGVGPLTSLVLGALFWFVPQVFPLHSHWPMWASVFAYLGFINIALALFNLLPGFPLDGGRILRALLWARWNDFARATARAADWGRGIAYGLIALGALEIFFGSLMGGLWLIFIAFFLKSAAAASYQNVVAEQVLSRAQIKQIMAAPMTMEADLTVAQVVDEYFLRYGYDGFPVVSDGRVVGMISLNEVGDCSLRERARRTVRNLMRPVDSSICFAPAATVTDALRQMSQADVGRLLVMERDELVGLISRSTIARFLLLRRESGRALPPGQELDGERSGARSAN